MGTRLLKNIFLNFLIDEGAYDEFAFEILRQNGMSFSEFLNQYSHRPEDVFIHCFPWPLDRFIHYIKLDESWRKEIA